MGLLGDEVVELILRNNTVSVRVRTLDHLLKDGVVSEFPEVLGDLAEVLKSNESWIGEGVPVLAESKVMKTLWTSSRVSFSEGRVVIMWKNSGNSIWPLPSESSSAII
jgi:hypothetical protein